MSVKSVFSIKVCGKIKDTMLRHGVIIIVSVVIISQLL